MSNNLNQWSRRRTVELTCPSGNVVMVRRPGPSMALKVGRIARILEKQPADAKSIEAQLKWMESLSDDELDALTDYAERIMPDIVVSPVVSLHPKEGEYHPSDLPVPDFWDIFLRVMHGLHELPVKLKEGETTVGAVQNFPLAEAGSIESVGDSEQVQ